MCNEGRVRITHPGALERIGPPRAARCVIRPSLITHGRRGAALSELEPFFNSAEECATYEQFCAEQERGGGRFELAEPALVCRWRMARRGVPMLNRHIRALSQRVVNGAPLTTNMLSWAKQHVEWSLAAGDYQDPNGVLMTVIDVNGDALMTRGPRRAAHRPVPRCPGCPCGGSPPRAGQDRHCPRAAGRGDARGAHAGFRRAR